MLSILFPRVIVKEEDELNETDVLNETEIHQVQELLLNVLPQWNYQIAKPFKQILEEGVSIEMYYCLQTLRWLGGVTTMSELGQLGHISKQQMTKIVNRLVENHFVTRACDPTDRRIIKIEITDTGLEYIRHFLDEDVKCFKHLLEQLEAKDLADFKEAVATINQILYRLPYETSPEDEITKT